MVQPLAHGKYFNEFTSVQGPFWIYTIKFQDRFMCPACPLSNAIHHLEEFARTAHLSVGLSQSGLLMSPQTQHTPLL
ncbi:hypothetical protein ILYODFUR_028438 [Ilyodon furcidens]|uniref:Uncharacterized protein n=1 Tax=Ilyodon furcidens TaxID=33524 RepID=A0ABV0ULK2_9TELE